MRFTLLIIEPRGQREARSAAQSDLIYAHMAAFGEDLKTRGKLLAMEALTPDAQATRIAMRHGRRSVIDGPFADTGDLIGGFFLLECESRDEALAIAVECPAAEWATVEVRESGVSFR